LGGLVEVTDRDMSHPNRWSGKEKARYWETGRDFIFRFIPECGTGKQEKYELKTTVYGAFDKGNRSIDFNLGNEFYCENYHLKLDLTKYVEAEWPLRKPPELRLKFFDSKEEFLSDKIVDPTFSGQGRTWEWRIRDIQNAGFMHQNEWSIIMVHLEWDVEEGSGLPLASP
jgi:hypothetical protein